MSQPGLNWYKCNTTLEEDETKFKYPDFIHSEIYYAFMFIDGINWGILTTEVLALPTLTDVE